MSRAASAVDIGTVGVFVNRGSLSPQRASAIESMGYHAIWVGGSPDADLESVEALLAATAHIAMATGIVNVWSADADTVSDAYHRIERTHPGRLLLGIGAGHPEVDEPYTHPYRAISDYLDILDAAGVPPDRRVLAALGPRMLELAARRSAGAHPYLVTPAYTRYARSVLGGTPLLAVEHKVLIGSDEERLLSTARNEIANPYLSRANMRASLVRMGFDDHAFDTGGTDEMIRALVAQGDTNAVAEIVPAHVEAGADHVALQAVPYHADPLPTLQRLAAALQLQS